MIRALVVCLGLAASSVASADIAAYHCNGPKSGPVRVIEDDGACRGFMIGKTVEYFSRMISGTLLVSKDGKTIVLVEDYLYGGIDGPAIVASVGAEQIVNPVVVQIWRDGKRVGMYDAKRLVQDVHKVRESESHVMWVAALPSSIEARFTLTTTSGREITFDSKTGDIVGERAVLVKP